MLADSTSARSSYGIYAGAGLAVTDTTISQNGSDGVYVPGGVATLTGNTITNNGRHGIYLNGDSADADG